MDNNTILRIKVPAHLYESVKEQLSLTEAKKQNYGAGYSVVKEKKMAVPKEDVEEVEEGIPNDGMKKVEETKDTEMEKKTRSLEELKAAKAKLDKKIKQMEGLNENFNEAKNMSYQEIKEGEDKTNPGLEEKAYPYFDTNNVDRHDEIVDLFPIVWADLKKNTNIYAGLVIDLLFHWVHGTKETGLMKLYKDKFLKKGKNK